jgi:hypothetical protein
MGYLEEQLITLTDEILLEKYPAIFLELEKVYRDLLSKYFYVGPNSKQKSITKEEAIKVPYSNGLIVVTDGNYEPWIAILGSRLIPLSGQASRTMRHEKLNRKKVLERPGHFFYISPDEDTAKKLEDREREALPDDTLGPNDRKIRRESPHVSSTKGLRTQAGDKSIKDLINKYKAKKKAQFFKNIPKIKETIKKLEQDMVSDFYKNVKNSKDVYFEMHNTNELYKIFRGLKEINDMFLPVSDYDLRGYNVPPNELIKTLAKGFVKKFEAFGLKDDDTKWQ